MMDTLIQWVQGLASVLAPFATAILYYFNHRMGKIENDMKALSDDIAVTRSAHQNLQIEVAKSYPTKDDFDRFQDRVVGHLEKLEGKIDKALERKV